MERRLLESTATSTFYLNFWTTSVTAVLCLVIVVTLQAQRWRLAFAGFDSSALSTRLVILPVYEAAIWGLGATFFVEALLLGIPGPYPTPPAWFSGALYDLNDSAGEEQWQSSILYWCVARAVA